VQTDGFEVLDPLAAAEPSDDFVFFRVAIGRNNEAIRLTDDF
jgi:hypothetical protein